MEFMKFLMWTGLYFAATGICVAGGALILGIAANHPAVSVPALIFLPFYIYGMVKLMWYLCGRAIES